MLPAWIATYKAELLTLGALGGVGLLVWWLSTHRAIPDPPRVLASESVPEWPKKPPPPIPEKPTETRSSLTGLNISELGSVTPFVPEKIEHSKAILAKAAGQRCEGDGEGYSIETRDGPLAAQALLLQAQDDGWASALLTVGSGAVAYRIHKENDFYLAMGIEKKRLAVFICPAENRKDQGFTAATIKRQLRIEDRCRTNSLMLYRAIAEADMVQVRHVHRMYMSCRKIALY